MEVEIDEEFFERGGKMRRREVCVGADKYIINESYNTIYISGMLFGSSSWADILKSDDDGLQKIRVNGTSFERRGNESEKDFIRRARNS